MKNTLRAVALATAVIMLALAAVSCGGGKEIGVYSATKMSLNGMEMPIEQLSDLKMELKDGGKAVFNFGDGQREGDYTVDGNKITLSVTADGETETMNGTIDGNTITFEQSESSEMGDLTMTLVFEKK